MNKRRPKTDPWGTQAHNEEAAHSISEKPLFHRWKLMNLESSSSAVLLAVLVILVVPLLLDMR